MLRDGGGPAPASFPTPAPPQACTGWPTLPRVAGTFNAIRRQDLACALVLREQIDRANLDQPLSDAGAKCKGGSATLSHSRPRRCSPAGGPKRRQRRHATSCRSPQMSLRRRMRHRHPWKQAAMASAPRRLAAKPNFPPRRRAACGQNLSMPPARRQPTRQMMHRAPWRSANGVFDACVRSQSSMQKKSEHQLGAPLAISQRGASK